MAQFKFELVSDFLGTATIQIPVGWDTRKPTLSRNTTYSGLFRSFTVDLEFVGDGYDYVKALFDQFDILAECVLNIYEYNNGTHEFELQDSGELDFTEYKVSDKSGKGATVPVSDTSFHAKIKGREDVLINYDKNTNLDGDSMSEPVYNNVDVFGMEVYANGKIEIPDQYLSFILLPDGIPPGTFWVPTSQTTGQIKEGNDIIAYHGLTVDPETASLLTIDASSINLSSQIELSGVIKFDMYVENDRSNSFASSVWFGQKRRNTTTEQWDTVTFDQWESNLTSTATLYENIELDISGIYNVEEGDVFYITIKNGSQIAVLYNYGRVDMKESSISINQTTKPNTTTIKGAFIFDVINRQIESITGVVNGLSSFLFGATGRLHDYTLQNGLLLRNYETSEAQLSFKFKDLFQDLEKIFNIGIGIENNQVVLEDKKDFFQDGVIHTITASQIEADSFSKEVDTDYYYSDIEIGYAKSAYEEISGLEEYNNKSFFNTFLSKINNKIEGISKLRGDGYGMTFALLLQKIDEETEDTKYDQDNFILNVISDGLDYIQLTTEGFTNITGIDQITTPINLAITPARNLSRWGWMIAAGLQYYQDKVIKFNKSDAFSDLSTTSDEGTVKENQDVTYEELGEPLFTGKKIIFSAPLTLADYNKIKSNDNKYKLIKVWNPIDRVYNYGWIKEAGIEAVDKATNWELIEAANPTEVLTYWLTNDGFKWLWNDGAGLTKFIGDKYRN